MSESDVLNYFFTEYKKRLPNTEENKDFHEHLDYIINYYKTNHIIYQDRWDDWISPNDERYWRNPTKSEKVVIEKKRKEEAVKTEKTKPVFILKLISMAVGLIGALGIACSISPTTGHINLAWLIFSGILVIPALLIIFYELGIIPHVNKQEQ